MNKKQLIRKISEKSKLSQTDIKRCLDILGETIINSLKMGEEIKICNFGKFYIKEKAERKMYSPNIQRLVLIDQKKSPAFKSSANLTKQIF